VSSEGLDSALADGAQRAPVPSWQGLILVKGLGKTIDYLRQFMARSQQASTFLRYRVSSGLCGSDLRTRAMCK